VCPISKQAELADAIEEARNMVQEANERFRHCRITFQCCTTIIESDNAGGASALRDSLERTTEQIRDALANFKPLKARKVLNATKAMVEILADPAAKQELAKAQAEARELATEIANLIKDYEGNSLDAMASQQGVKILQKTRKDAEWAW
jgi:hypothetical protein